MAVKGVKYFLGIAILASFSLIDAQILSAQTAPLSQSLSPKKLPSAADFAFKAGKSFTVSPNGKQLAFMTGEGKDAKVVLINVETGESKNINLGDKTKPRAINWAGNNYLIIHVSFFYDADDTTRNSNYRYEIQRSVTYNLSNGKTVLLMPSQDLQNNVSLSIEYMSQDDPKEIIMAAFMHRETLGATKDVEEPNLALFKTSLDTGRGSRISMGSASTVDFVLDASGQPKLRIDKNGAKRTASLLKLENRSWKSLLEFSDTIELPFSIEGFLDAETLLIIEESDNLKRPKKLNIQTGAITPMFETETRSVSSVIMDPYTRSPIGLVYDNFTPQLKWLSPDLERFQTLLQRAFPGKYVYINDWDKEKKSILIGVESGDTPYSTYLFDTKKLGAELLTLHPEGFEAYEFAPKTIEKMTASDGLEITVLVTRPRNSSGKKLPSIVLPHGGPEASDDPGFDYESQFLASRGYVVIQPQFRGSTGFGTDFAQKGYGEWAGKMQSDVNETVKWAADKGWIDKDRVCIVGSSFGGYSALVGVAHTPDLYKCAASFGGVFDLAEMQERAMERGGRSSISLAYWKEHMGLSRFDRMKIRAISPVFQAQNVKVPVLLMHGIEDTVVPIKQSRDMANALRRAGKTVQLIEFEREDHWLSRQETRERYLVELEKFLAPILKPQQ